MKYFKDIKWLYRFDGKNCYELDIEYREWGWIPCGIGFNINYLYEAVNVKEISEEEAFELAL